MSRLWQSLEAIPGGTAVAAEWRSWVGNDWDAFRTAFLQRADREAKVFPCPLGCGCAHVVHERARGGFVGVCQCGDDADCEDLSLTADDITVWELNRSRLGRAVARAFGCEPREARLGLPGTFQIGAYGGTALPLVLTMQDEQSEFQSVVERLLAKLRERFILLAPTSRFIDAGTRGLLANVKAGCFDLASHLTLLPSGVLHARQSGAELFSAYLPEQAEAIRLKEAMRIFAVLTKLRAEPGKRKAPLHTVFELTVLDGLSQKEAAKRCKPRCVPALITTRVRTIEERFGMSIDALRAFTSDIREMDSTVKGDRMRKKKQGTPAVRPADEANSDSGDDDPPKEEYAYDQGADDA